MRDVIEFQINLKRVQVRPLKFHAVISQDVFDLLLQAFIKRQRVVVQHGDRALRLRVRV